MYFARYLASNTPISCSRHFEIESEAPVRRKLDQMQINLQELRNEDHSLKNENTRLKDIIINRKYS